MNGSTAAATPFKAAQRADLLAEISRLESARAGDPLIDALLRYTNGLPRFLLSRCPITNVAVAHSIDNFGLDGLWWHYWSALRPEENLPPTYYAMTGAMNLGRMIDDTNFLVGPGPEVPFVVPRMLEKDGVVAVISYLRVGPHDAYPIFYFANPIPSGLRFNTWGRDRYFVEENGQRLWNHVPEDSEPLDYDLAPWIGRGKLLWIQPGDAQVALQSATEGCPFIGLEGRRGFMRLQYGRASESGVALPR